MEEREKPTNQVKTVEIVGLWSGKSIIKKEKSRRKTYASRIICRMSGLARGDDSLTVLEKTYAIAKLIEDSRFWQVSGDIREW